MIRGEGGLFNRKNTQKIAAIIILIVIVAMLATMVLPYIIA